MSNVFQVSKVLLYFNTKCTNTLNDTCPICRVSLLDKCIHCSECTEHIYNNNMFETTKKECISIFGKCGHGYHKCCINEWLRNRKTCPLDNEEWIEKN